MPFRFDDFPRPVRVLLPEWINFHFVERQVVIETESVVGNTVFAQPGSRGCSRGTGRCAAPGKAFRTGPKKYSQFGQKSEGGIMEAMGPCAHIQLSLLLAAANKVRWQPPSGVLLAQLPGKAPLVNLRPGFVTGTCRRENRVYLAVAEARRQNVPLASSSAAQL
ncbi:hypothetical protein Bsp3421_000310 (plasmid) [Burkholderia sp. FERM BP-3421]|uniref:hypothetical protein n=1 Tax=Burkholderia sp. FERM BP-3421 TaxID=1494466 RepID=UPI00235DE9E7|nr:hypothetical protein [Burkholderia sp. FERM BP-3421]WDD90466.1 hypothetical protein Bsp3421_000310 [Burkholderia sp. FERM BP-3421]